MLNALPISLFLWLLIGLGVKAVLGAPAVPRVEIDQRNVLYNSDGYNQCWRHLRFIEPWLGQPVSADVDEINVVYIESLADNGGISNLMISRVVYRDGNEQYKATHTWIIVLKGGKVVGSEYILTEVEDGRRVIKEAVLDVEFSAGEIYRIIYELKEAVEKGRACIVGKDNDGYYCDRCGRTINESTGKAIEYQPLAGVRVKESLEDSDIHLCNDCLKDLGD